MGTTYRLVSLAARAGPAMDQSWSRFLGSAPTQYFGTPFAYRLADTRTVEKQVTTMRNPAADILFLAALVTLMGAIVVLTS